MDVVNQGQTYVLGLTFTDENGNGLTPSSASYRIDVEGSNVAVVPWTPFSPSANTYNLVITAAQNALQNANNAREERVVTLQFGYGLGNEQVSEYRYMLAKVENFLNSP